MAGVTSLRVYRSEKGSLKPDWAPSISYRFYDINVNGEKLTEISAVPFHLKEMALGFLLSNGYVEDPGAVEGITVNDSVIDVRTTPDYEFRMRAMGDRIPLESIDINPVTNSFVVTQEKIMEKLGTALNTSDLDFFLVSDTNGYTFAAEDVKPSVALYKVVGKAHMDHFDLRSSFFVTSFVLMPEDIVRLAYLGVPVVGTTKLPTDLAVTVAENLGITLFSVTVDGVVIYSHPSRIQ